MIKFCFEDSSYYREPELITLCLQNCSHYEGDGAMSINHSVYGTTLLFVRDGEVTVLGGKNTHSVSGGRAVIISPGASVRIESEGGCSAYVIEFFCQPDELIGLHSGIEIFLTERDDLFNYVKLYEKFTSGVRAEWCEVILLDLLYGLLAAKKDKSRADRIYDSFCEYCREHSGEPLSVSEIAAALGCGSDHLSRVVKKSCGMTAKEYIVESRLTAAMALLRSSGDPIEKIGQSLGFPTVELFNKFLKYHLGRTAAGIRKES